MSEQETEIGKVLNYYANIGVAAVELSGSVKVGDTISFRGLTTDLEHEVDSMQIEHESVEEATAGEQIGIKIPGKVRKNDRVYLQLKLIERRSPRLLRILNAKEFKEGMGCNKYARDIPELLVSAYSDQLIEEDELLRLWKAMGCPEPEQLDKSQISNSQVVIDVLSGESVVPASLKKKEPTVSEQLAEIERLYLINPLMPGYCSSKRKALGEKDISSLEKMNENHPLLLEAVLDHRKKEWTAESAMDLLDVKGFEEHPDAVIEVLEGGHWKAAAIKRDLLQL